MAEFQEVMHNWNRMCRTFDKGERCTECPIPNVHMCWYIGDDWIKDEYYDEVEKIVMAWAAEHPEPVYPTWKEWLEEQRVVVHFDSVNEKGKKVKWELTNKSNCPIPADIAQKLGIQPKEG